MAKRLNIKATFKTVTMVLCIIVLVFCFMSVDNRLFELRQGLEQGDGEDFVKVIDVGQGDSILIHSNGYSALIDTGTEDSSNDLATVLRNENIEIIDVLILTHLHTDHTGGVEYIFKNFEVQTLILPELSTFSDGIYSAELAIDKITRAGGNLFKACEDMTFDIGDFTVTVIGTYYDILDENNRSLIIKADIEGNSFLFMGDAEGKTERRLLNDKKDISCDVLKVGHHGSNTSTVREFLEKANPKYAAISVGKDNQYNHPHLATLKQLEKRGIKTLRTDISGDITFNIENRKIVAKTEY